jgi:hypothetical protein
MYAYALSQLTYLRFRRVTPNSSPAKLYDPPALHASAGEQLLGMFFCCERAYLEHSSRSVSSGLEPTRGCSGHIIIFFTLSARPACVRGLYHLEWRDSTWCVDHCVVREVEN